MCGRRARGYHRYEGVAATPEYARPAPALLGFDETIYAYCSAQIGERESPYYGDNAELASRCACMRALCAPLHR